MSTPTFVAVKMPLDAERAFYLANAEYRALVGDERTQTAPWVSRDDLLAVLAMQWSVREVAHITGTVWRRCAACAGYEPVEGNRHDDRRGHRDGCIFGRIADAVEGCS